MINNHPCYILYRGEYLWNGLDYIPYALKNWLLVRLFDSNKAFDTNIQTL